jgi:hypothetical protein
MTQLIEAKTPKDTTFRRIIVDKGEPAPPLPENAIVYLWHNRNSDFYDVVEDTNETLP